ncbi:hypothetical protein SUGI_0808060 [Cryptomeria japonica]|uniref:RING-H2 finger protein ATL32-like n=1 Tax=Cryptomeria japonica TaxID=3369 RepID=UPI002414B51D|nr:RING-H2 finger protein ATL32-like [Cryptomeria japonica]GLJ39549.1 hypothetical protein SUGI_0808060 [Cryptomeria japonica]
MNFTALTPADDGSFYSPNNLRPITPIKVARLADNKSRDASDGDNQDPYNPNLNWSVMIIGIILICIFCFVSILSIYARRRARRAFGQAGNNTNYWDGTQGLDPAVIESFPIFSYNRLKGLKAQPKFSDCAVCLTDFKEHEMLRLLPKCSHAFHPECIDLWLSSNTTCPVCRTSFLPADDSEPTVTDFDILQPQTRLAPPEENMVVIDNGHRSSNPADFANNQATIEASGNDSTGYSLLRVRKELDQGTQWFIASGEGLTPGLHWSCSFVANRKISQESASSSAPPTWSRLGNSLVDTGRRSTSERWESVSVRPPSLERSFSERFLSQGSDQIGSEQQDSSFEEDVELVDGKRHTRRRDGPFGGRIGVPWGSK